MLIQFTTSCPVSFRTFLIFFLPGTSTYPKWCLPVSSRLILCVQTPYIITPCMLRVPPISLSLNCHRNNLYRRENYRPKLWTIPPNHITTLGSRWRWLVSVTPRPRFTPRERTPGTHCTGGWVGPRAGLDIKHIVISSQVLFHNGSLLQSRLNTQLLITIHSSSRILTLVWQTLGLQQMRVMSSGF
jgi:hypothetical protein